MTEHVLKSVAKVFVKLNEGIVQLHPGLNTRLENKLSTHHDEIFKSVDSYLDNIKKVGEQSNLSAYVHLLNCPFPHS